MSGPSGLDPRSADARFVALYSDYHTLCYQVAWDVLGHHDQALDAAQEVFLQLLAGRPASLARPLGPAFFRIAARNQAIRILKRRRVRNAALGRLQVEQESAGVIPSPDLTTHPWLAPTVQRFLAGLPPLRARVFQLCFGEGFSSREAAEELGVSQKAVEKQREKLAGDLRRFRGGGEKWGAEVFIEQWKAKGSWLH
jgi:RNA polymerase sigma factor (sigma-70 family)